MIFHSPDFCRRFYLIHIRLCLIDKDLPDPLQTFFLCILKLLIPAQDVKILHELYFPDSKTLL